MPLTELNLNTFDRDVRKQKLIDAMNKENIYSNIKDFISHHQQEQQQQQDNSKEDEIIGQLKQRIEVLEQEKLKSSQTILALQDENNELKN